MYSGGLGGEVVDISGYIGIMRDLYWRMYRMPGRRFLREVLILTSVYFIYMLIRKFIYVDVESIAFSNAQKIIAIESSLGFFWEPHWQEWAIRSSKALVLFFNWAYIITFWPVVATTAIILYIKNWHKYRYYRNIVLLSFIFALILYALFPLAPPWLLPQLFVDTITAYGPTEYRSSQASAFYNIFAAMPSVHFAWTLLFGVLFISTRYKLLKILGVLYPTTTFFAIIITGNHYILDAVGGLVIAILSFLLYEIVFRRRLIPIPKPHFIMNGLKTKDGSNSGDFDPNR